MATTTVRPGPLGPKRGRTIGLKMEGANIQVLSFVKFGRAHSPATKIRGAISRVPRNSVRIESTSDIFLRIQKGGAAKTGLRDEQGKEGTSRFPIRENVEMEDAKRELGRGGR